MRLDADRAALDELTEEFDLLRRQALRAAKALIVAEDRRAAILHRVAQRADPADARDLRADAHQARANADTAMGTVVQLERMARHAVSKTGQPRVVDLTTSSELAVASTR